MKILICLFLAVVSSPSNRLIPPPEANFDTSFASKINKIWQQNREISQSAKKTLEAEETHGVKVFEFYPRQVHGDSLEEEKKSLADDPVLRKVFEEYKTFFRTKLLGSSDYPHSDPVQNSKNQEILARVTSPMNFQYAQYFDRKNENDTMPGKNISRIWFKKRRIAARRLRRLVENSNKFFARMLVDRDEEIRNLKSEIRRLSGKKLSKFPKF